MAYNRSFATLGSGVSQEICRNTSIDDLANLVQTDRWFRDNCGNILEVRRNNIFASLPVSILFRVHRSYNYDGTIRYISVKAMAMYIGYFLNDEKPVFNEAKNYIFADDLVDIETSLPENWGNNQPVLSRYIYDNRDKWLIVSFAFDQSSRAHISSIKARSFGAIPLINNSFKLSTTLLDSDTLGESNIFWGRYRDDITGEYKSIMH